MAAKIRVHLVDKCVRCSNCTHPAPLVSNYCTS